MHTKAQGACGCKPLSQIFKPSQNPSPNLPKPIPNLPKTLPKSYPNPSKSKEVASAATKTRKVFKEAPLNVRKALGAHFGGPKPPKRGPRGSQNLQNGAQNVKKSKLKNKSFSDSIFSSIFYVFWWFFFDDCLKQKCIQTAKSETAGKAIKHWPWRENQGSALTTINSNR